LSQFRTIRTEAEFRAPASAIWELLIDWGAIVDWMPDGYISSLECEGIGPGAVRHLVTGRGVRLAERLDRADESSGLLELSLVGALPWGLVSYAARGKVDSLAADRSRLSWEGTMEMPDDARDADRVDRLLRKSYAKMLQGIREVVES
jgi:hypothetical protein